MRILPVLLVVGVALAGCMDPDPSRQPPSPTTDPPLPDDGAPHVDAAEMLSGHHGFVRAFPNRAQNSTDHQRAREAIAGDLAWKAGPIERFPFQVGAFGEENFCRFQTGTTKPGEVVVVFGHYDSAGPAAGQGAYDNGAGFRMVIELGRAYANAETARTIAFCPIDGGDNGYTGSRQLLADMRARFGDENITAALVLDGFGLMWPIETPVLVVQNSDYLTSVVDDERQRIGVPDEYFGAPDRVLGGQLDAGPWFDAGVPVAFLISNVEEAEAPGPAGSIPGGYPFLHAADTVETMTAMAGDPATLQASFQNALDLASGTLWRIANDPAATP